jgi:DNA-binding transcriptional LysR family regulator
MSKAAQKLNLTQPAVSKAIAQMERVLGVQLLDRSRHGATPTIYGEAILQGGRAAFDELRQSVARVQYLADPNSGVLNVGCTQPLALGFIPSVIERMRRNHPGIRFHVVEGDQMTHLRLRRIELAVGRLSAERYEPETDEEPLFDDPLLVAAGDNNPWARRRKLTLQEIYGGPWSIPLYDSQVGRLIIEAFRTDGLEAPRPYVTTYSLHLHLELAAMGPFLTIIAKSMLRRNAQRLSLRTLPVVLRHQTSSVGIVKLKNRSLSPQAELFIKYARDVARSM